MWKYIALAVLFVAIIILNWSLIVSIGGYTLVLFLTILFQWVTFFMTLVSLITLFEIQMSDEKRLWSFMDYFTDNFKMLFPQYLSATILLLGFIITDAIPLGVAFIV